MINKFNSSGNHIEDDKQKEKVEYKKVKKDKNGNIESIGNDKEIKEKRTGDKFMNKTRIKSCIIMVVTFLILVFLLFQTLLLGKSILGKEVNKNSMILSNLMDGIVGFFVKAKEPETPIVEESEMKIGAIGDIYITNGMLSGYKTSGDYNFDKAFEQIKIYTENYDYVLANLETPIAGDNLGLSTTKKYNAPKRLLNSLKDANINVLSLANERIYDKEETGIKNTIENINEAGLKYVGASSDNTASSPIILEKDGIRVAILAYNDILLKLPTGKENLVNTYNLDKAKSDIESLKDKNIDLIITYMHFGNDGQPRASAEQRQITQDLYSLGVDIVVGSHPHVIQSSSDDVYAINENQKKRVFVSYSLGDFLGASTYDESDFGAMAGFTIKKEVKKNSKGDILSTNVRFIPDDIIITWQDKKLKSGTNMRRVIPAYKAIKEYKENKDTNISNSDYLQLQDILDLAQKILIRN